MNKLSVQVQETGFKTLFYDTPGAIATLIPAIITLLTAALKYSDYKNLIQTLPRTVLWIIYVILGVLFLVYVFVFKSIVCSARKSTRVLIVTGVQDKQDKIFNLLQEYLEFV